MEGDNDLSFWNSNRYDMIKTATEIQIYNEYNLSKTNITETQNIIVSDTASRIAKDSANVVNTNDIKILDNKTHNLLKSYIKEKRDEYDR